MARDKEALYRENILEHYRSPHHWGKINHADVFAHGINANCGDEFELNLKISAGKIIDAKYSGAGCAISIASASMLSDRLIGKKLSELPKIKREDVLSDLGIDPGPSRLKCALLSWHTLQSAMNKLASKTP